MNIRACAALIAAAVALALPAQGAPQSPPGPPPVTVYAEEDGPWRLFWVPFHPNYPELGTYIWMMETDFTPEPGRPPVVRVIRPHTFTGKDGAVWSWFRESSEADCAGRRIRSIRTTQHYADGKVSANFISDGAFESPTSGPDFATLVAVCKVVNGEVRLQELPRAETAADALAASAEMEKIRAARAKAR